MIEYPIPIATRDLLDRRARSRRRRSLRGTQNSSWLLQSLGFETRIELLSGSPSPSPERFQLLGTLP